MKPDRAESTGRKSFPTSVNVKKELTGPNIKCWNKAIGEVGKELRTRT
jgi:hypothetical protein